MKRYGWLFLLMLSGESYFSPAIDYSFTVSQQKGEFISQREELMGRSEYHRMVTADPKTGEVPADVLKAEIAFADAQQELISNSRAQQLDITPIGPNNVGGRTRAVSFDIRDENILLAGGVSGSVYKSTDGGSSWRKTSHPENRNSVTCIVQDIRPGREDTWYHGTGEIVGNSARGGGAPYRGDGIYKSTDNGETWFPLTSTQNPTSAIFNSQFQYVWGLEINPANQEEDEVLAAVFGGILRSTDGGQSWEVVLGQELYGLSETADLNLSNGAFFTDIHRSADHVFYATLSTTSAMGGRPPQAGFYLSENGIDWQEITPLASQEGYRRVVVDSSPSDPDLSYFLVDRDPPLLFEHRRSLIDNPDRIFGFDPTPREIPEFKGASGSFNTQGSYNLMVRVHPENPDIVFMGATNLYRSTDGYRTQENIKWVGGYNSDGSFSRYPDHHPDQHDLIFVPSSPNVALSASDGGLIQSQDITADSVSWSSKSNGFVTSQFFTVAQAQAAGDPAVIGGMQDNGTDLSVDGNLNWSEIIGGDGAFAETTRDNLFWLASFQRGQTLRLSLDQNQEVKSFARVDPGSLVARENSSYLFINPFVVDPRNENRAFFAGGSYLYFHPNIAQIPTGSQIPSPAGWKKAHSFPVDGGTISAVEVSSTGSTVYFGTSGGALYRLSNAEDDPSFETTNISSNLFPEFGYVSCVAVDPEDKDHLMVVFSNYLVPSLFESTDGGASFQNVSGNLEQNPDGSGNGPSTRWAEIIPTLSGPLFLVGTSVGLYSTKEVNGNATVWLKESADVIGKAIIPMMDYRSSDGRLVIATHGNGMFETTIHDFKEIQSQAPSVSESFEVISAYPNPFQDEIQMRYSLPKTAQVRVDILTGSGQLVKNLLWAPQYEGMNAVVWDGTNTAGISLPNGIYFFRIQYRDSTKSVRVLLRR